MNQQDKRSKVTILSIGAAVQDVYLQGKIFTAHRENGELVQEFTLGTKNEVENVLYSTGGGATNASVTFARQGLHAMYMGQVGPDIAGQAVIDSLHTDGVDTSLVKYSPDLGTGYSLLLLAPNGERTILTYRGASEHINIAKDDFNEQKPDWIYISSLSGDFVSLERIVAYATQHNIKLAINPGAKELAKRDEFKKLLPKFTILSLNKEEAAGLFNTEETKDLIRRANELIEYVAITDGGKGCVVGDRKKLYHAGQYQNVQVVDRAGAGDAFCSGFVASIAAGESVMEAITFASANSTSVVATIGAKTGILRQGAKIHAMPMRITPL